MFSVSKNGYLINKNDNDKSFKTMFKFTKKKINKTKQSKVVNHKCICRLSVIILFIILNKFSYQFCASLTAIVYFIVTMH